jgi:hypothetical protein
MQRPQSTTTPSPFARISLGLIGLVFVLAYLRFTARLGLYWDEYNAFYMIDRHGFDVLLSLASDQGRPLQAHMLLLLHALWPGSQWVMAGVILVNALLVRQIIRWLVPSVPVLATLVAVVYLTTPIVWMSPHLTNIIVEGSLMWGLISVTLGYLAVRLESSLRWPALLGSLLLIPVFFFTYEMIIILEFVQALLVWRAVAPRALGWWDQLRRAALWILPWFILSSGLFYYRFFLYETAGYWAGYADITSERITETDTLLTAIWTGIYENTVLAWPRLTQTVLADSGFYPISFVLALAVFSYALVTYRRGNTTGQQQALTSLFVMTTGALLAIFGNTVVAVGQHDTGLHVQSVFSRVQVVSQLGIIAVWLGLLLLVTAYFPRTLGAALLGGVVAGGVYIGSAGRISYHQHHVETWALERTFLASLTEAVPGLADDAGIVYTPPFDNVVSDFGNAVNFIQYIKGKLIYQEDASYMLTEAILPGSPPDYPVYQTFTDGFSRYWLGDISRSILVYGDETGCAHLINPLRPLPTHLELPPRMRVFALDPAMPDPATVIRGTPPADTSLRERYYNLSAVTPPDCATPTYNPPNPAENHSLELIEVYTDDTPILIEDASGRLNVHLPDMIFPNVPDEAFIHATEPGAGDAYAAYVDTSGWVDGTNTDVLLAQIGERSSVWVVRRKDDPPLSAGLHAALLDAGYIATERERRPNNLLGLALTTIRYEQLNSAQQLARFGDDIDLVHVNVTGDTLAACETTVVQSFWQSAAPTAVPYSVTMNLLDANGEGVARSDGQLSLVPSNTWEPGEIYLDEREITAPCEGTGDAYTLAYGVYDWRDRVRLPVIADGVATGNDLYTMADGSAP